MKKQALRAVKRDSINVNARAMRYFGVLTQINASLPTLIRHLVAGGVCISFVRHDRTRLPSCSFPTLRKDTSAIADQRLHLFAHLHGALP